MASEYAHVLSPAGGRLTAGTPRRLAGIRRWAGVGIAAQVVFVASWLAAAAWQGPRYSVMKHSISEMYAVTAPHAVFLVVVLTLCGAATIWFAVRLAGAPARRAGRDRGLGPAGVVRRRLGVLLRDGWAAGWPTLGAPPPGWSPTRAGSWITPSARSACCCLCWRPSSSPPPCGACRVGGHGPGPVDRGPCPGAGNRRRRRFPAEWPVQRLVAAAMAAALAALATGILRRSGPEGPQ